MMSNERFHWSLIWKTFDLGQTFEFGNETTRSEFGSRGKPGGGRSVWPSGSSVVPRRRFPVRRSRARAGACSGVAGRARNRGAEGGSLRGPNRLVPAALVLPTP